MSEFSAPCGLDCTGCPAHVATLASDEAARRRLAAEWSTPQISLTPEDMYCDGCLAASNRVAKFCLACDIRDCALALKVETCADCESYPCDKLDKVTPEQRTTLDALRAARHSGQR